MRVACDISASYAGANSRILITGAGGFLGSHIADLLLDSGYQIIEIDSNPDRHDSRSRENRDTHRIRLPHKSFESLLEKTQPRAVVHCTGTADVGASFRDPSRDFKANVEVTEYVLECVRKVSPATQFILLSSAAVYGEPAHLPIAETAVCNPISPYGYHKLMCEQLLTQYRKLYGIHGTVLRIFSAYGERLKRQAVHDLCERLLDSNGVPLSVVGTGHESRDFIHAEDVARAVGHVLQRNLDGIYNVASGRETRIHELVDTLLDISGNPHGAEYSGWIRKGDPTRWQADISKLSATGFQPKVSLPEGLHCYYHWLANLTSVVA